MLQLILIQYGESLERVQSFHGILPRKRKFEICVSLVKIIAVQC